jgi:hypothetical protein
MIVVTIEQKRAMYQAKQCFALVNTTNNPSRSRHASSFLPKQSPHIGQDARVSNLLFLKLTRILCTKIQMKADPCRIYTLRTRGRKRKEAWPDPGTQKKLSLGFTPQDRQRPWCRESVSDGRGSMRFRRGKEVRVGARVRVRDRIRRLELRFGRRRDNFWPSRWRPNRRLDLGFRRLWNDLWPHRRLELRCRCLHAPTHP